MIFQTTISLLLYLLFFNSYKVIIGQDLCSEILKGLQFRLDNINFNELYDSCGRQNNLCLYTIFNHEQFYNNSILKSQYTLYDYLDKFTLFPNIASNHMSSQIYYIDNKIYIEISEVCDFFENDNTNLKFFNYLLNYKPLVITSISKERLLYFKKFITKIYKKYETLNFIL